MIKKLLPLFNNPWFLVYFFIPFLVINLGIKYEQQFVYLAYAFLHKSLSLIKLPPTVADLSYFNGQYYWPLGIFPGIILTPFVWLLGASFRQGFIQFPLNLINFWFVLKIGQKLDLAKNKAVWLAIFFIFGSVYTPVGAISFSWYFAQVVGVSLTLFAIYEFLNRRRWLVIGLLIGLSTLTRTNLIVSSIFFAIYIFKRPVSYPNLIKLVLPILLSLLILGAYNFQRFGSIFESGYSYQLIPQESALRRAEGLISAKHIPANLYYMLIKTPDPVLKDESLVLKPPYLRYDPYGMSIFFMSPILFLIFMANFREPYVRASFLTTFVLLISISLYYGIGYKQVGYRYALDFLPFLLIPLISAFKKVNLKLIIPLVLLGVFLSWFFTFEKIAGF